jgi:hypothetical protein
VQCASYDARAFRSQRASGHEWQQCATSRVPLCPALSSAG